MKTFFIFAISILILQLNFASAEDLEYNENIDDGDYVEGPLERLNLDDEDSDVHVIGTEDELRQVIFNPRKRRERRKRYRGKYYLKLNCLNPIQFFFFLKCKFYDQILMVFMHINYF